MTDLLAQLRDALPERYRVDRQIGQGGMATVFVADDTRYGRKVAVKVLNPDLASTIGAERFEREIQVLGKLSHPHILPVLDSGESNGLFYYVMPFVEGESLRDRLIRDGQLPVDEAVAFTCDVADALAHAHRLGIIHRDIKPENVLIHGGHAVVADFGIARLAQDAGGAQPLTMTGMSVGTAAYMSPEQAVGDKIDTRSDIYSLGCMLYELLAGEPPFTGPNSMAIMARQTMERPRSIRIVRQGVPLEIEEIVLHALEKSPVDRFKTMDEFKQVLLGKASVGAWQPTGSVPHRVIAKTSRRQFAVMAGTLLVLLGAGFGIWRWRQQPVAMAAGLDPRRIGVLYFDDESKSGELRYLADGLTESLIDRLSEIAALDVVSRNGVLPYRGTSVSIDSIGRALKVGSVVKGTVEPTSKGVRVTVRLVDASSETDLGRKSFEYDTARLLALRDTVADRVALFLREQIGPEVKLRDQRRATRSADAWMLLQRAERRRKDADSLVIAGAPLPALFALGQADSLLARSQDADRNWSTPSALRASIALARASALRAEPAKLPAIVDSGIAYADRALSLDPRSADALEYKGKLLYFEIAQHLIAEPKESDRTLVAAESTLTRSVAINKNQAGAWAALAALHYRKPDLQAVLNASLKAYEADAYLGSARTIIIQLFLVSYNLEQFPEAMKWLNEFKRRFPNDRYYFEGRILMYRTKFAPPDVDSAWTYYRQWVLATPEADRPLAGKKGEMLIGGVLANAGLVDSARHVLLRARAPNPQFDVRKELPINEAAVRVMLKDYDLAVDLIRDYLTVNPDHRKGFANRVGWYWRDLQNYPKFKTLIVGLQ